MADIGISLNFASKKEHVPKIDQFNRNSKERVRYARAAMHFKRISKLMIIHIVATAIFWLNIFPPLKPGAGMSNTKVPIQLVPGTVVDFKKFCRLQLG